MDVRFSDKLHKIFADKLHSMIVLRVTGDNFRLLDRLLTQIVRILKLSLPRRLRSPKHPEKVLSLEPNG